MWQDLIGYVSMQIERTYRETEEEKAVGYYMYRDEEPPHHVVL